VALYIGLMSGTSLDGIDAVLVDLDGPAATDRAHVLGHAHSPYVETLRAELLALNSPGHDELHRAAVAANRVALAYAHLVERLLTQTGTAVSEVAAIGAHGQTVRHRPQEFEGGGYTLQLLNGALLAELTSIDIVCDFRSRDLAAGGQGAPLVPAFHAERFSRPGEDVAVLNLGGIANLTLLPATGQVLGFDCGPGNALMDAWCRRHLGTAYDQDGRWAASGQISSGLLTEMLAEPFFSRQPPKSTGRDLFNVEWLQARLSTFTAVSAVDIMTTLTELTASTALSAIDEHQAHTTSLLVCGGGAYNRHLMARLAALRPGMMVSTTADAGIVPDQVEALAFAWLAREFMGGRAGNLSAVTGAQGPRPLGVFHPASLGRLQSSRNQP
jgi:anhydro-N-acetylmuramic acid kinase